VSEIKKMSEPAADGTVEIEFEDGSTTTGLIVGPQRKKEGELPSVPELPEDLNLLPPPVVSYLLDSLSAATCEYVDADQFEDAKRISGMRRRVRDYITEKIREQQATCDCESCVERRAAEKTASKDAVPGECVTPPSLPALAPDGGHWN
jgi:hypothetical protein